MHKSAADIGGDRRVRQAAAPEVEAGQGGEMRHGSENQASCNGTDYIAGKVQAGDERVERQRAR